MCVCPTTDQSAVLLTSLLTLTAVWYGVVDEPSHDDLTTSSSIFRAADVAVALVVAFLAFAFAALLLQIFHVDNTEVLTMCSSDIYLSHVLPRRHEPYPCCCYGKSPTIVNIALSQLCVGAHLRYLPRADSELQTQLSYMGGRPPLPYTAVTFPAVRLVPNYAVRWVTRGTCV